MRNRKGAAPVVFLVSIGLIGLITGKALLQTAENGTFKKNRSKIWCKMQNKGNDYCDSIYPSSY